jgi:hypothetical protein
MSTTDPEHLDDVDRKIRINELKEQARELAGGEMTSFEAEDIPPEVSICRTLALAPRKESGCPAIPGAQRHRPGRRRRMFSRDV